MGSVNLVQAFLNRESIPGVLFQHNDFVSIVSGSHKGHNGSLVSVLSLTPEPRFVVEIESGFDVETMQSEIEPIASDPPR
jgi:hypothetical protein